MKSERLFDSITEIDEEYIEEAKNAKFQKRKTLVFKLFGTAAACFAAAVAVGIIANGGLGASAGGGMNREPGENYMSYAGPAFPLTALEDTDGIEFERSINFDFSPYYNRQNSYEDSDGETVYYDSWNNDAIVYDNYTATNMTDEDITFTAVYPFAGNISTALSRIPQITVNGESIETKIEIGPYSGGFSPAWGDDGGSESLNLSSIESWYEYKALLENGEYIKDAFGENPDMDIPVKVYEFGIEYNIPMSEFDEIDNPDAYITFDYDTEKTKVFFCGFNSMSWDSEEGWVRAGSYIPKSFNPDFENHPMYIIVMGGDIDNIAVETAFGYIEKHDDEREKTDAFSITSESYEATLGEVILDIISAEKDNYDYGGDYEPTLRDMLSDEDYLGFVAEFMYAHGQLSENPAERYDRGRLDDIISETGRVSRVLYVTFEVIVPAGETVRIGTSTLREASYDFVGGRSKENLEGFDLVTRLGTNLDIVKQSASVSNTEEIGIVYNNFGFDIPNGITEVILGDEEHYWMEIRKIRAEEE